MRHNLLTTVRRVAVLAGLAITAACSTDTTAPVLAPTEASAVLGTVTATTKAAREATVRTAGHLKPLRQAITAAATIGVNGGVIRIPETGFELQVPAGAVDKDVRFSVTAIPGSTVAYEFAPHGMTFKAPLKFRQSVLTTSIGWGQTVRGGYFTDAGKIDAKGRKATVLEQMPARIDGTWVVFEIWHFSGYLVSCA
jgi:ZU5 domain